MLLSSPSLVAVATCLVALSSLVSSHTVITYPGWRGDNLLKTGDVEAEQGLGVGSNDTYPYGMQWIYPCSENPFTISLKDPWLIFSKAEACEYRTIVLAGPSVAARLVSNLAGSRGTRRPSSTLISARAPSLRIIHYPCSPSSK